jgi:amino acid adenylation domain-containing protein
MEQGRRVRPANPFIEFKKEEIEQSIPARFEEQVRKYPERPAVKTRNSQWSYDELNKAANRAARAILEKRGEGPEPIALLLEQGAAMIVAILGVLKAGKIYVPLDPLYPRAKLSSMMEDSQTGLVVSDSKNLPLAGELVEGVRQLIDIDEIDSGLTDENPGLSLPPDTLAYILYTSGSTGQPKGVVHNHRNVLHFIRNYTNDLRVSAEDRQSLLFSCSVAAAVKNIFGALLNGATLLPFNLKEEGLVHLSAWLIREGVTLCQMVPTVYRHFASALTSKEMFPKLRVLYLGGEPLFKRDVELYRAHFSECCILVNALASTELNTIRQYFIDGETRISGRVAPVGYAVEDTEILLLDETGAEVGCNRVGEIALKSRYLAVGYWRKPELTRSAFLPDPAGGAERIYCIGDLGLMRPDGCLEYHGRKDFQIKIRGQRVEAGEIEITLLNHPAIKEAVVLARADTSDEQRIVAYVVPARQPAPAPRELRRFLEQKLPNYMIPSVFVFLESLPLTLNGKVDRHALPRPGSMQPENNPDYAAPMGELESQLVQIWEDLLAVCPIGTRDDFFDLGGHSLLAVEMMDRIERASGKKLPLSTLLEEPTIQHLAQALVRQRSGDERSLLIKIQSGGARPPFFFLHGDLLRGGFYCRALAHALGEDQPFYALAPHGLNGSSIPKTVEAMAASYLRIVREAQTEGPYFLGGACNGGLIAFEMARQIERQGQKVDLLVLVAARGRTALARILLHGLILRPGTLFGLGPEEKLDFFLGSRAWAHRVRELYRNCLYRLKLRRPPLPEELPPGLDDNARAVLHSYSRVVAGYVPGRYPGRVVVLWPDEERFDRRKDPAVGWGRVTSNLEVKIIPGTHTTYLTEHLNVWGPHIKNYLEKAQGKS